MFCFSCTHVLCNSFVFFKLIFVVSGPQKKEKTARELIEVPVKELTFDQLQLLKVRDKKRENLETKPNVTRVVTAVLLRVRVPHNPSEPAASRTRLMIKIFKGFG